MNTTDTHRSKPPDSEIASKIRKLGPPPESTIIRTVGYLRNQVGTGNGPKKTQTCGGRGARQVAHTPRA